MSLLGRYSGLLAGAGERDDERVRRRELAGASTASKGMRMWFDKKRVGRLTKRGDIANASRQWAEAEIAYRNALELNPRLAHIWVQYGHALKEQGKLGDAEQAYWRSLSLDRVADTYLQLGHVLKLESRFEEAKLAYATSRALNPALTDATEELARLETVAQPSFHAPRVIRVPFDAAAYASASGIDVADALIHYVSGGFRWYDAPGGSPAPVGYMDLSTSYIDDFYRIIYENNFDPLFYWNRYPDICLPTIDPLDHFYLYGWREGRDPSALFSVEYYLAAHPDVRVAGIDPFVHHLLFGKLLGRSTSKSSALPPPRKSPGRAGLPLDAAARTVQDVELYRFSSAAAALAPPTRSFAVEALDIHVVVPDFSEGAGGHMNIFRICNLLEAKGHRITIWIRDPVFHMTPEAAGRTLHRHFQPLQNPVRFVSREIDDAQGDIILATDWRSVPIVTSVAGFKRRFYFVQDFEPAFFPAGARALLAESTYRAGLDCICGGPWLEQMMRTRYGLWARKFWQAADTTVYRDVKSPDSRQQGMPRIAFYVRMFTERRAVEIGLLALEILAGRGIKFHVDFFGQTEQPFAAAPYSATHHGVLDGWALAEIYNRAVVGMALSATNYSIVPQEMMACGLAIVDVDVESTRAVYADIARLADPTPEAVADTIQFLLTDDAARAAQAQRAKKWVSQFSWASSADLVEAAFIDRLTELLFEPKKPAVRRDKSYFATVVIPTYNGGALLHKVVERVLGQRTPGEVQLLCVDSSSEDGTNERLRDHPGVELATIRKQDFQHGRTRNLAVEMAKSEFVAFLTQDALPSSETWLYNLVCVLKSYSGAGAVFGRHTAHDDASAFLKRDINRHFAQFDDVPVCIDPNEEWVQQRWRDQTSRQRFHFYSDNNSCLRKSIWRKVPIPCLEYGEDQAFAYQLLQHGYGKAYARNAVVFHSHDDAPEITELRSYDEAIFYYRQFGYRFASSELSALRDLHGRNLVDEEFAREHEIDEGSLNLRIAQNRAWMDGGIRAMRDVRVLPAPAVLSPARPRILGAPSHRLCPEIDGIRSAVGTANGRRSLPST